LPFNGIKATIDDEGTLSIARRTLLGATLITGALLLFLLFRDRSDALRIRSRFLEENRRFLVDLPPSYALQSQRRYPVLYLLDGGDRRQHSRDLPLYTRARETLSWIRNSGGPELILVGIDNVSRERDMLPIKRPEIAVDGGGAAKFCRFITRELIPEIEKKYRCSGERILYGESYGGLFAFYVLAQKKNHFRHILAISPAVGAADHYLQQKLAERFRQQKHLPASVVVIYGEKDAPLVTCCTPQLFDMMKAVKPRNMILKMLVLKGKGHNPHQALKLSLKMVYPARQGTRSGF
jgi:predicted alpha/beta superfamily hydrolase